MNGELEAEGPASNAVGRPVLHQGQLSAWHMMGCVSLRKQWNWISNRPMFTSGRLKN
jgi:hypothetical protein